MADVMNVCFHYSLTFKIITERLYGEIIIIIHNKRLSLFQVASCTDRNHWLAEAKTPHSVSLILCKETDLY